MLTLALFGVAAAASASPYYYEYYLPSNVDIQPPTGPGNTNTASNGQYTYNDTVTYHTFSADENGISDNNSYTVYRESNWDTALRVSDPNNFYRIEIGHNNDEKIRLYLTDYVSNLWGNDPVYKSNSNALFNDSDSKRAIVEYGYRKLTWDGDKYVAGDMKTFTTVIEQDKGPIQLAGLDDEGNTVTKNYILNTANVTAKDTLSSVIRYQYDLGTFNRDDVIELYMKDNFGQEVYSFSSLSGTDSNGNNVYTPFNDQDTTVSASTQTQGGFGEGGWVSGATGIGTDAILYNYYFNYALSNPNGEYHDYTPYLKEGDSGNETTLRTIAAQRAMPLSQLIPGTWEGKAVTFGLYGIATGEALPGGPLPGGLQSALIAGLFGLGFFYVRRRKAIVG